MRNAIVLAAGKGTRMKSDRSKVMHTIIDRSMLAYIIDALRAVSVQRIVVIVGYQAESIKEAFPDVEFALQQPQLGTGHAVMQATQLKDEDGDTLIINGDGPCIHIWFVSLYYFQRFIGYILPCLTSQIRQCLYIGV